MRRLTPPRIRAIYALQFIVQVHQLVAATEGGESSELAFSELLHGNVATGSPQRALSALLIEEDQANPSLVCQFLTCYERDP